MSDFQGRTKSVSLVRAMFATRNMRMSRMIRVVHYTPISLVIMVAESIKRALLVYELEG
jgi:hypothetical protein